MIRAIASTDRKLRWARFVPWLQLSILILIPAVADGQIRTQKTLGPVTVDVELQPEKPVIGDLLELTIHVVAQADVEVLMPEFGEALGAFQIVDFSPREKLGDSGESIFTQTYKLQSPPSGDHYVPPILIEFVDRRPGEQQSPEDLDAYEIMTDRLSFTVASVLVSSAAADLNPPLDKIQRRPADPDSYNQTWVYIWLCLGVLAVAGIAALVIVKLKNRVVRRSAFEIAINQLEQLVNRKLPEQNQVDLFYVELTLIIRRYLENRFELRAPELTTEEFLVAVADSAELTPDHKKLLQEFLRHADLVKFAGIQPSESDIEASLEKANRFLMETQENAPLLEDTGNGLKSEVRQNV